MQLYLKYQWGLLEPSFDPFTGAPPDVCQHTSSCEESARQARSLPVVSGLVAWTLSLPQLTSVAAPQGLAAADRAVCRSCRRSCCPVLSDAAARAIVSALLALVLSISLRPVLSHNSCCHSCCPVLSDAAACAVLLMLPLVLF